MRRGRVDVETRLESAPSLYNFDAYAWARRTTKSERDDAFLYVSVASILRSQMVEQARWSGDARDVHIPRTTRATCRIWQKHPYLDIGSGARWGRRQVPDP